MALSVNDFGKTVVAAGLVPADDLKALVASISADSRPRQAAALAKLLVDRELLTRYQADELLAGRGMALGLGDYIVQDKIGAGGMGQVLKAVHRKMGRTVALKLMSASAMKDEAAIKRFHREVKAAARLEHENIVTAHAAGEARGMHYLVMQYVEGSDLSGRVKKEGPLSVDLAMECICQAAQGLAYAHSEGIIHRDIKPANLLLDKKGVVKILDMGLARIDGGDTHDGLTGTEQVLGTVDYMSPEQAISTRDCDARADIYSLGCTLWYLLTGTKMYSGDSPIQRLMQHREAPLPSLLKARDDIPWALEKLFHKMVAKQPADRIQTMDEVVQEIEQIRGGPETSRTGAMDEDTNLGQFFKTVGGSGGTRPSALAKPAAGKSSDGDGDTLSHSDSRKALPSSARQVPPWKNSKVLAGAGAAAILFLLLGVWIVVRDKEGKPVAQVKLPDSGSVEVKSGQADKNKSATKSTPTTASVGSPFTRPASSKREAAKAFTEPAFQAWMKTVATMPAEQQIEAVSKKLMELNPGFDGNIAGADPKKPPLIAGGLVLGLGFYSDYVTDLSPVRVLQGLTTLRCGGSDGTVAPLSDFSPLEGMSLTYLNCGGSSVSDLSRLKGMKLTTLYCGYSKVSDLSALTGMPLSVLQCDNSQVQDLSALSGMSLKQLRCDRTLVSDLSPLRGMPLEVLFCNFRPARDADILRSIKTLNTVNGKPAAAFWQDVEARQTAFEEWLKETQTLQAEQQIEAVSKKLMELNPGFDGKVTPKVDGELVTGLTFVSNNVPDISPVRAFSGLKVLNCNGSTGAKSSLSDLSPLVGMPLVALHCINTQVSDLSPLQSFNLADLRCTNTNVIDLSPLKGSPLVLLWCDNTQVSDLSPLETSKNLQTVKVTQTKVTPAAVGALQKALPNCKIEWDDPAKAIPTDKK